MTPIILAQEFQSPTIEYSKLAPMLIVFGAAILGVLLEAFLPRRLRYPTHVVVALVALVAALVTTIGLAGTSMVAAEGAVAIDGFTLFLWGTIIVMAIISVLLLAERHVDGGVTAFAAQASRCPAPRPSVRRSAAGSSRPRCSRSSSSRSAACCCSPPPTTC